MRKLLNYSIETDQLILLHFSDGQSLRVPFQKISDHLTGHELSKVSRAIKLRRDFFRNNLPKTMVALAAAGLAVAVCIDYENVAALWSPSRSVAPPPARVSGAAQSISTPSPSATAVITTPGAAAVPASAPASSPAAPAPAALAVPTATPVIDNHGSSSNKGPSSLVKKVEDTIGGLLH